MLGGPGDKPKEGYVQEEWPRYQCLFPTPILRKSTTHTAPRAETPACANLTLTRLRTLNMFNMLTHPCIPISGYCHHELTGQSHSAQATSTTRSPPSIHYILQRASGRHILYAFSFSPQELKATELAFAPGSHQGCTQGSPGTACFFGGVPPSAPSFLDTFSGPPSPEICTFSTLAIYPLLAVTNKPRNAMCEGPSVHSELKVSTGLS